MPNPHTPVNQRRQPRTDCSLSVQVHAPTEDVLIFTYATNLSAEGVFVRTHRPLPIGTPVNLEIHPANSGDRVAIQGTVVRATSPHAPAGRGMGLSFVRAGDDARRMLRRIIEGSEFAPATV